MVVESHLQTQRAAIKMLHERIVVLVRYVTEVVAGNLSCCDSEFGDSERNYSRPGDQRPRGLKVVIRVDGFPTGDGESRVP